MPMLKLQNNILMNISALHKKCSFPLRISPVNVTKSAGNCGFGHIYWRNFLWKTSFFLSLARNMLKIMKHLNTVNTLDKDKGQWLTSNFNKYTKSNTTTYNFHTKECENLKVGRSPSKQICVICLIESPFKIMKNAFYFILETLLVLKIFSFLSRLFGHVAKTAWLERYS